MKPMTHGGMTETARWYQEYYGRKGLNRNNLLHNPEVLFQTLALDVAIARCLRRAGLDETTATVLDVGCGSGMSLSALIRLGFHMDNLVGVDQLANRVAVGRRRLPGLDLREADARRLDIPDASFDLVLESTMFAQVTDATVAAEIASEMRRVVKPTGFLLLADWRLKDPRDSRAGALPRARVRMLFPGATLLAVEPGALVPPVGRRLSRHAPSLYFALQRLAPFLVGQVAYLLRP